MNRKKTGGRQKGTPNKATAELRKFVSELIEENKELIKSDFLSLPPRDRIVAVERLLSFVLPKPTEPDEPDEDRNITIQFID
jgi:hypothetical protein